VPPIDPAHAQGLLEAETRTLPVERVSLEAARGAVLAETVRADRDFPAAARSAMDGFALRAADVPAAPGTLELIGEIRAGQPVGALRVGLGQAVRIMTGGLLPPGADAVVMVEVTHTTVDSKTLRVNEPVRTGQHVRLRGSELAEGTLVLEPGAPIEAPEIAALVSVGRTAVEVFRRPTVAVLATGDEVVEPGRPVLEHQVRNSNAHALVAQLGQLGLSGRYLGIAGDERDALERSLSRGLTSDVLLVTGGVSVGEYDLVARTLESLGLRTLFHGVAVKPGQPLLAGRAKDCLVFGLPGNPVSTFTMFAVFVAPALRRMMGYRAWADVELRATLEEPLEALPGRKTYHLARLAAGPAGLTARRIRAAGSGDVLALARANGFIVTAAEGARLARGATVGVQAWPGFHLRCALD
jgi:molybdopterin molybdotransferase